MTDGDLRLWKCYHNCQQHLASLPLFDGICYTCGELLFSKVRGHFFQRYKDNMDEIAPIAFKFAQLPDIPYKSADRWQWYCCPKCFHNMPLCPSYADPAMGNPDMPSALQALPTAAAKRAISLCSIYSSTFRKCNPYQHQWCHIRGGVTISHKMHRHYYKMFGYFMTRTPSDYDLTSTQCTIKNSLHWLRANNPFYRGFFSNYETLYHWHVNPLEAFHNADKPKTSDKKPLDTKFLDKKDGLILPLDDLAKIPPIHARHDKIEMMHLDDSVQDAIADLQKTTHIKYNDLDLEAKAWPTLFLHGCGSWIEQSSIQLAKYQKSQLLDVDPHFRNNPFWSF